MNVNKLKGKIVENQLNLGEFSERLGVDKSTLYRKITGNSHFTIEEAAKATQILQLSDQEAYEIFLSV